MIKLGQIVETIDRRFPKAYITKTSKTDYTVMLLLWDVVEERSRGWITATDGTLKECRDYLKKWFLRKVRAGAKAPAERSLDMATKEKMINYLQEMMDNVQGEIKRYGVNDTLVEHHIDAMIACKDGDCRRRDLKNDYS